MSTINFMALFRMYGGILSCRLSKNSFNWLRISAWKIQGFFTGNCKDSPVALPVIYAIWRDFFLTFSFPNIPIHRRFMMVSKVFRTNIETKWLSLLAAKNPKHWCQAFVCCPKWFKICSISRLRSLEVALAKNSLKSASSAAKSEELTLAVIFEPWSDKFRKIRNIIVLIKNYASILRPILIFILISKERIKFYNFLMNSIVRKNFILNIIKLTNDFYLHKCLKS